MARFPIANYARTLNEQQLKAFLSFPMLRHNPMRAIDMFESKTRHRA